MAIVGTVPKHLELVVAPEDVGNTAAGIARTRTKRPVSRVQVLFRFLVVRKLQEETLGERDACDALLREHGGREVFEFLVGFLKVSDPDGVGTFVCRAVTGGHDGVQRFTGVFPCLATESRGAEVKGLLWRHAL